MKYRIYAIYTATKYIEDIEANSEEEALELFDERESDDCGIVLCHHCSSEIELDHDPSEFRAEPI